MKRVLLLITLVTALLFMQGVTIAGQRVIVVFEDGTSAAEMDGVGMMNGCDNGKKLGLINGAVFTLPARAADAARAAIAAHDKVKSIDDDVLMTVVKKPADKPGKPGGGEDPPPPQVTPWGIDRIDADLADGAGTGVKVAVIDTGIDKDHADLAANIQGGVNFVVARGKLDPNKWDDDNGHGTHCAGIIAALNNDIGVVGVAPEASLFGVKVLDKRGSGYLSAVIDGIGWCINNGMDVASMSLSTASDIQGFHDAVDIAYGAGLVIVAAAGNDGASVDYPAAYATCIAVSATTSLDAVTSWSNRGPEIDFAAPGYGIYSTVKGGKYDTYSGTSMACPHVAGAVALLLQDYPSLSTGEVHANLPAEDIDLGVTLQGKGLIDAEAASKAILPLP